MKCSGSEIAYYVFVDLAQPVSLLRSLIIHHEYLDVLAT